jgi:hypothetical protein
MMARNRVSLTAALVSVKAAFDGCTSKGTEWGPEGRIWYEMFDGLVSLIPTGGDGSRADTMDNYGPRSLTISATEIAFSVGYRHPNDRGRGWTHHSVVIRPTFTGVDVAVSGLDRDGVAGRIRTEMTEAFSRTVVWCCSCRRWRVGEGY